MTTRTRLPDRRRNETISIRLFGERPLIVSVGYDNDGNPKEVFVDGAKEGSDMRHTLADACVIVSIALQHGVGPTHLAKSLGTLEEGQPASPIGVIVRALVEEFPPTLAINKK